MKTSSAILIACLLVASTQAKYSGGTGDPNDPYQIATVADLIALGQTPADYGKHFILTADLDLDPNLPGRKVFDKAVIAPAVNDIGPWTFEGIPFTGTFDGNGHTIKDLKIRGAEFLGLFGCLGSTASVSNLGLEGVEVSGKSQVGGLAGWNKGFITNSYSTGSVNGTDFDAGGLVGSNDGSIRASYSSGSVSGKVDVGGLAGSTDGYMGYCYSESAVTGQSIVGGLVGYVESRGGSRAPTPEAR